MRSAVRAAAFHDAGWYAYETAPRLLPSGKPMGFTQVPLDDATLTAYQWATDWMVGIDVPTAVVVTTRDRHVPPEMQLRMADSIPHSTVHPIESGHSACTRARFVPPLLDACSTVASRATV